MLLPPEHGSSFGTLTAAAATAGVARLRTLRYSASVDSTLSSMLSPTLMQWRLKVHGAEGAWCCRTPETSLSLRLLPTRTKLTLRLLSGGGESVWTVDWGRKDPVSGAVADAQQPPKDPEPESRDVLDGRGPNT